jgi:hypothetical protein
VLTGRAKEGVAYRWLAGDLRHLRWALANKKMTLGQAVGEFRPCRGTAHGTESLLDPGPLIARTRYHLNGMRKGPRPGATPAEAVEESVLEVVG